MATEPATAHLQLPAAEDVGNVALATLLLVYHEIK
jgi:hypothetical protein